MKNKKQFLGVVISVLICVFVFAAIVYATTTIGNDITVGGMLTISEIDENGQIGYIASISANTDGVSAYGIYQEVDVGTGVLSTGSRNGYGIYQKINNNADYNAGWTYGPYVAGITQVFDATTNAVTYRSLYGIEMTTSDYTGDNTSLTAYSSNIQIGGSGSAGTNACFDMNLKSDDGVAQTGTIIGLEMRTAGAGDTLYGLTVYDNTLITGGTGYGVYIDVDDTDWTNAYSVYIVDGSAASYFGNATASFGGDVEIGNGTAGHLSADTENLYVEGILEVDGISHFDGLVSVSDTNGIQIGGGATFMTGATSQSAACVVGSLYVNTTLGNISICDADSNWSPITIQ